MQMLRMSQQLLTLSSSGAYDLKMTCLSSRSKSDERDSSLKWRKDALSYAKNTLNRFQIKSMPWKLTSSKNPIDALLLCLK